MDVRMEERNDGRKDRRMEGKKDGRKEGWKNGRKDERKDGRKDGVPFIFRDGGQICAICVIFLLIIRKILDLRSNEPVSRIEITYL